MSNAPKRLLIVEDHDDTRKVYVLVAKRCGYAVDEAASVSEALAKLDGQSRVILDLRLPDGDGADVLQAIRALHKPASVAVISAEHHGSMVEAALRLHPDAYFKKPVDGEQLVEWLSQP